jgi:hypothetical protein
MAAVAQHFRPEHAIDEIADFISDPVEAVCFPEHRLRFRNDKAAAQVGLDTLSDEAWIGHFGRFIPFTGSLPQPLALRYHGHQFRVYNPDIGDGRGFLFAQCRDERDRLMDLGTKGSGTTPYSRFGDGRLTLKGGVREVLATEMLEALGVATSRTFSVVETGETLVRGDEPSPTRSAVLVRLNYGHIRIGSFQRLAALGQTDELERLVAYSLKHYYGETMDENGATRLLGHVAASTARLAASFMAAGFVHGVLNSDNINISGESFDYGPGGSHRLSIPDLPPPISTREASTALGGKPRRFIGTSSSLPWRCKHSPNPTACPPHSTHSPIVIVQRWSSGCCGVWASRRAEPTRMSRWFRPWSKRWPRPNNRSTAFSLIGVVAICGPMWRPMRQQRSMRSGTPLPPMPQLSRSIIAIGPDRAPAAC